MAKVVVIYDSKTGNTELMAQAIAEGAKSVEGTTVIVQKLGTKWPVSLLKDADAVIVGSPTRYGNITQELTEFFQTMNYLQKSERVVLKGKKGAAFGSYGWDGGWNTSRIEDELKDLGVKLVAAAVSAVDQLGAMQEKIGKADLAKCRELGKKVAKAVTKK
jgi:NAD(P)H dehydrogenase (quinone)